VSDKREPSDRLKRIVRRKYFFVTTMNYYFCSNITILHCINKAVRKRTHR
jgi:hypothetical protein